MSTATSGSDLAEKVHSHSEQLYLLLLGTEYQDQSGEWWWRAPYRADRNPSLRVNTSTWVWVDDTDRERYGGDVITLAALIWRKDYKKDFVEICTDLLHLVGEDSGKSNGNNGAAKYFHKGDRIIHLVTLTREPEREEFAAQYGLEWSDFVAEGYGWSKQSFQSTAWKDIPCIQYPIHDYGMETLRSKWKSVQRRADGDKKRLMRITPSGTRRRGIIGAGNLANCVGKSLVIAGGEEKQIAAVKAGFFAVCPDTGEKRLSPEQIFMVEAAQAGDIIVCFDADKTGDKAAAKVCQDLFAQKAAPVIRIVRWPEGTKLKTDLNDMLKEHGLQAVKDLLDSAEIFHGDIFPDITPAVQRDEDVGEKVNIQIGTDESKVIDQCVEVLAMRGGGSIFTRGGDLVRVKDSVKSPDGDKLVSYAKIEEMTRPAIRTLLTRMCTFLRYVEREQDWVPAHPPEWLAAGVDTAHDFSGIHPLLNLSPAPILRSDASVFNGPGYDPMTAMFVTADAVPWDPPEDLGSVDRLVEARDTLLDLVCDFEFTSDEARSSWMAALLTMVGRNLIEGPCPAFKVDANAPGSGKGLLLHLAAIIATGQELTPSPKPSDDAEWNKFVTTQVNTGAFYVFLDNILTGKSFTSPHLEAVLTSTTWSGRILGTNDTLTKPAMMIWFITGNNVSAKGDLIRRVLNINLRTKSEHPELRDNFKYPNIMAHTRKNRKEYLGAALTIIASWIKAGRPRQKITPWGSYEAWSDVVRQAILHAGMSDPCRYRLKSAEECDADRPLVVWLCDVIEKLDAFKHGIPTILIMREAPDIDDDDIREGYNAAVAQISDGKNFNVNVLARTLTKLSGRIVNGRSIEKDNLGNKNVWLVLHHSEDDPTASGDDDGGLADSEGEELF